MELAWITYLHPALKPREEEIREALERSFSEEWEEWETIGERVYDTLSELAEFQELEKSLYRNNRPPEWFDDVSHTSVPFRFEYAAWLEGNDGGAEKIIAFYYDTD